MTVQIDIRFPKIYANAEDNVTDFIALSQTIPDVQKSISGRANTWIEIEIQNAKYWSCETPYLSYLSHPHIQSMIHENNTNMEFHKTSILHFEFLSLSMYLQDEVRKEEVNLSTR